MSLKTTTHRISLSNPKIYSSMNAQTEARTKDKSFSGLKKTQVKETPKMKCQFRFNLRIT